MLKKVLVLFVLTIVLNSCSDCPDDCCLGDPCFGEGIGGDGLGIDLGDLEISEEALEAARVCDTNRQNVHNEYDLLEEEIYQLYVENTELIKENEGFWEDYDVLVSELKASFESEGGDLEALEEKIILLTNDRQNKIDELNESSDQESQEYRDATRLLDLELVEGIVRLFSEVGSDTASLSSQFLDWFKENKQKVDEEVDYQINALIAYDLEVQRLDNERSDAILALNCS